jgi:hypothetical protein
MYFRKIFIFVIIFCIAQKICYAQHIPLGITREELPKYVNKIGGGHIIYAPPGVQGYVSKYFDSSIISVDSLKLFGYKGYLSFNIGTSNKISMFNFRIKDVFVEDFNKISKAIAQEFHLKMVVSKKIGNNLDRFWGHLKNKHIDAASIALYPDNIIILSYASFQYQ